LRNRGIFGDLLAFLIQSPVDFHELGEITDANKVMNAQHFGSNPADIWIRIRIVVNPDLNPGSLSVEVRNALVEVCAV